MGLISSYGTLLSEAALVLNRRDLTSALPGFVQSVEDQLRRHPAVEYESDPTALSISAPTVSLPADCKQLKSLYYDSSVRVGSIDILFGSAAVMDVRAQTFGLANGVPRVAAIIENGTKLQFGPPPDTTYPAFIVYLTKLARLAVTPADAAATNWVLAEHSDIYLYGTLVEASAYIKNDERITLWQSKFDNALAQLDMYHWNRQMANVPRTRIKPID